jgi:hypothetical protein
VRVEQGEQQKNNFHVALGAQFSKVRPDDLRPGKGTTERNACILMKIEIGRAPVVNYLLYCFFSITPFTS